MSKFNKLFLILSLLFILSISIGMVSANDGSIVTTSIDNQDMIDSVGENECLHDFDEIQSQVDQAKDNNTIELNGNYIGTGNQITINKSVRIQGNGATLDARNLSRIFLISADNVVLENINFINGKEIAGGAIYCTGSNCKILNCNFTSNIAEGAVGSSGGAIYGTNTLYCIACNFINNRADDGGALAFIYATVRCNFTNNIADLSDTNDIAFFDEAYNCKFSGSLENCVDDPSKVHNGPYLYVNDVIYNIYDDTLITAYLEDENGNPLINKVITLDLFGYDTQEIITNDSGIAVFDFSSLGIPEDFGNAQFKGDNSSKQSNIVYFNIYKVPVETSIDVGDINTVYGKTENIKATVKDQYNNPILEGYVIFEINGKSYTIAVNNGTATISCLANDIKNIKIKSAYHSLSSDYATSSTESYLNVSKTTAKMTVSAPNSYYKAGKLTITLKNLNGNYVLANEKITVKILKSKTTVKTITLTTNANGVTTYNFALAPGTYSIKVNTSNTHFNALKSDLTTKIYKASATITPTKLTTTYDSGKYFQVKVLTSKKQVMVGVKLKVKVYTGSKYKSYSITTGSNGIAKLSASKFSIRTHKVIVSSAESKSYMSATTKTSYITVKKATTIVSAPKVTNKYNTNSYFKVTIKNKATGKVISSLSIKIKVYTGKSYKTYIVKTNSKGVASLNTKAIKKGTHKVVISTSSKYYTVSKSGYLIIIK